MHIIEKVLVGSREDESMVSKKTVAVIFGGQSSEHEVSRTSAVMMLQALDKEKYQVLSVGITKKGQWLIYNGPVEHVKTGEWERAQTFVISGRCLCCCPKPYCLGLSNRGERFSASYSAIIALPPPL